jgi:hypothetical protein
MLPHKKLIFLSRTGSFPKIEIRQSHDRARNDPVADRFPGLSGEIAGHYECYLNFY